eukprot:TRINITY_DN4156_c0_g1_i1.p2 TRINITY_DN4156_c0_g1~~TRINITY_DN4156_c0_g1_i1.p2  ORF type:complete len:139 (+),score=24.81 TRINITY_DN4156_c0_g1_i1:66-482(+)
MCIRDSNLYTFCQDNKSRSNYNNFKVEENLPPTNLTEASQMKEHDKNIQFTNNMGYPHNDQIKQEIKEESEPHQFYQHHEQGRDEKQEEKFEDDNQNSSYQQHSQQQHEQGHYPQQSMHIETSDRHTDQQNSNFSNDQ